MKPYSDEEVGRVIGHELRMARQRSGADLYDVADLLRIKPSYLFALENGDHDAIPGMPYVLGFMRSYADHLGLDGQKITRRFKAGEPAVGVRRQLKYPILPKDERRPYALVAMALMVLAGAGYGGWTYLARQTGSVDVVAEAPFDVRWGEAPEPDPVLAQAEPPATAAAVATDSQPEGPSIPAGVPAAPETVAIVVQPALPTTQAVGTAAEPAKVEPPVVVAEAVPPAAPVDEGRPNPGVGAAVASEARVVLIATEAAWIQVRSADRQFSRSRLMEGGERFPLPDRTDLALWTGNAGGLQVMVDGTELAPLGPRGAVLKNVPLDPAGLKARFSPQ